MYIGLLQRSGEGEAEGTQGRRHMKVVEVRPRASLGPMYGDNRSKKKRARSVLRLRCVGHDRLFVQAASTNVLWD